jgi:squalene-hopene/tetraprenyl-beta-curcumene cyclase
MIDRGELTRAYQAARRDLLARRVADGHWVGLLSASALSTATAASALAVVAAHAQDLNRRDAYRQLAREAVDWLARRQREDGGWGDTDKSLSNVATTMLAQAAFHLTGSAEHYADRLRRAQQYVESQGGLQGLRRRYGKDKTFATPILTNCALAGMVPWQQVTPLPFELACLPQGAFRFLRLPVVSYAIPALVAVGQARFFRRRPRNPFTWIARRLTIPGSLKMLARMQPASGGFLEAVPLTSFVVMSLAATGRADHPVVRAGVKFLLSTVRDDRSWPIDANLATWNTTGAAMALASATGDVGALGCLDWLLSCQHQEAHPFTDAAPGGWGWSDLSGAVPDVDDTAGALLALSLFYNSQPQNRERIGVAARAGLRWLLDMQNRDGGWPTFCRGWGRLPFDRSGTDLTAHALRAIAAWRPAVEADRFTAAIQAGFEYLARQQGSDGSWIPLWFGNQYHPTDENPVYGTSRVLLAYGDLDRMNDEPARRGLTWLADHINSDGGFGSGRAPEVSSTEETAVAVEALVSAYDDSRVRAAAEAGIQWLIAAVRTGRHQETSPIGLYFAKLWYYECTYPLSFTVAALGRAVRRLGEPTVAGGGSADAPDAL